jgi:hypothetical protein
VETGRRGNNRSEDEAQAKTPGGAFSRVYVYKYAGYIKNIKIGYKT